MSNKNWAFVDIITGRLRAVIAAPTEEEAFERLDARGDVQDEFLLCCDPAELHDPKTEAARQVMKDLLTPRTPEPPFTAWHRASLQIPKTLH